MSFLSFFAVFIIFQSFYNFSIFKVFFSNFDLSFHLLINIVIHFCIANNAKCEILQSIQGTQKYLKSRYTRNFTNAPKKLDDR